MNDLGWATYFAIVIGLMPFIAVRFSSVWLPMIWLVAAFAVFAGIDRVAKLLWQRAILARWLAILLLAIVSATFVYVTSLLLLPTIERAFGKWAAAGSWLIPVSLVFAGSLLWVPLMRAGCLPLKGWRLIWKYPPTVFAALLGASAYFFFDWWRHGEWRLTRDLAGFWISVILWLSCPLLAACITYLFRICHQRSAQASDAGPVSTGSPPDSLDSLAADAEGKLIPWLMRESPIDRPGDDLFETRHLAQQIAQHLLDARLPSIALFGPRGSGKSSLVQLAGHYVKDAAFLRQTAQQRTQGHDAPLPMVLLCVVRLWGLSGESAQRIILRKAVSALAEHVDCLSLWHLDERYATAFRGGSLSWVRLPLLMMTGASPEEQLRSIERVLTAANIRLVICIEDLDRNVQGPDLDIDVGVFDAQQNNRRLLDSRIQAAHSRSTTQEIMAMIDQIQRETDHLSFILAISEVHPSIDFSKISEQIEEVPQLPGQEVWNVILALRKHAFTHYVWTDDPSSDVQPASPEALGYFDQGKKYGLASFAIFGGESIHADVVALLNTPRTLKSALRRTWVGWRVLHGEVDFDDLLICKALGAVSPNAYDFLVANHPLLMTDHPQDNKAAEQDYKSAAEQWIAHVKDVPDETRDCLWRLVGFMFPKVQAFQLVDGVKLHARPKPPAQGVQSQVYWDRVRTRRVDQPIRDQTVLRDIRAWKAQPQDSQLVRRLASDEPYADVLARLACTDVTQELYLSAGELRSITSDVLRVALLQSAADTTDTSIAGFASLGRALSARSNKGHVKWLYGEISKAFPVSLALANGLRDRWTGEEFRVKQRDRLQLRANMLAWAKENMTPQVLAGTLGIVQPFSLHHFAEGKDGASSFTHVSGDIAWFGHSVLGAIQLNPAIVIPHVCNLVSDRSEAPPSPSTPTPVPQGTWSANRELASRLVPDPAVLRQILSAIASSDVDVSGRDEATKGAVLAVRADARTWLEEMQEPAMTSPAPTTGQPPGSSPL